MSLGTREKRLIEQGEQLFGKKRTLDQFWQEVAENFYPQRADFTSSRYLGADFAQNLTTSYPIIASRTLQEAFETFLRPPGQVWSKMSIDDEDQLDNEARKWLEWATKRMAKFQNDKLSGFNAATKQCDADYVNFGQGVIRINPDFKNIILSHRCIHLRDVAWCDDENGLTETLHFHWKPTAIQLINTFRDKSNATLHSKVVEKAEKTPYEEVNCHHIMMKSENYRDGKKWKQPFVSIWIDVDNNHIIEEVGSWTFQYIIPQWQKVSGSQYAYSPAVVAALPDARLLQAITLTLLEAGEKAVNPPMIATQDAVRGDVRLDGGSINWVDSAYDERLGEALRPITLDKSGLQFGIALREDIKQMLVEAFYLNKLQLPMNGPQMTATESTYRIQEWVRNAMPLFGPGASNYNEPLQEMDFKTLLHAGAFIQNPLPPCDEIHILRWKTFFGLFNNPPNLKRDSTIRGRRLGAAS